MSEFFPINLFVEACKDPDLDLREYCTLISSKMMCWGYLASAHIGLRVDVDCPGGGISVGGVGEKLKFDGKNDCRMGKLATVNKSAYKIVI